MNKPSYHIDFETYSVADLKNFGAYRYASDESTEILIMAIAKDDEKPLVWERYGGISETIGAKAVEMFQEAIESGAMIYAHNAQFEAAICKYLCNKTFGFDAPELTQWRCTAAMARRAAIPSSLSGAGEFLGLEESKDKAGAALIRKFSIPKKATKKDARTRITAQDEPEDFGKFVNYCIQDVEAERAIHKKLSAFELIGAVLSSFQFDLAMNDRGVPVNVKALEKVDKLINEYSGVLREKFIEITGFKPASPKVVGWMQERGYPFDNMQADNVDTVLDDKPKDMTQEAFEALKVRSKVSYAAVKKVPTMLAAACPDGFVRGSLLWSGAERTHRWAGRIIQPQNFRRPTIKGTELAYKMLSEGADIETIELLFGSFLEVVASCIRHFIHWEGGKLNQADFSSVEARGAAWLCGEEKKLQMFRNNEPIYESQAANIFGVPVSVVSAAHKAGDSEMRFIGKQAELGCTYQMGWATFRGTCEGYKYKPSAAMVEAYKPIYFKELKRIIAQSKDSEPWDKWQIKFPKTHLARFYNKVEKGTFAGRGFMVQAYKPMKRGVKPVRRSIVDMMNPTEQELQDLTYDNLSFKAVTAWRENNPQIVAAWKSLDVAAKKALRNPGKVFKGCEKITLGVTEKPGFRALVLKLPSGHTLIYPRAKLVWKGDKDAAPNWEDDFNTEIQFWGKVPNTANWGWCKTYGGKLLENATQGICGDFMANGAVKASLAGYDAFMLVHDELIGPQYYGQDHVTLCNHLCDLPSWAKGMPLAAEGDTIPFYKK